MLGLVFLETVLSYHGSSYEIDAQKWCIVVHLFDHPVMLSSQMIYDAHSAFGFISPAQMFSRIKGLLVKREQEKYFHLCFIHLFSFYILSV